MIPPIEAKAIREWIGENKYGYALRNKGGEFLMLDAFMQRLDKSEHHSSSLFVYQIVPKITDAELETAYAQFLLGVKDDSTD